MTCVERGGDGAQASRSPLRVRNPAKWPIFLGVLFFLTQLSRVAAASTELEAIIDRNQGLVNGLWVLVATAFVFFMQAGFLAFEIGCVRPKNTVVTALKNMGDWVIVSVVFMVIGFGLMFGPSSTGIVGEGLWMGPEELRGREGFEGWTFFLYQLAFAGTAATIVSGAMAERTGFKAYLFFTVVMGAVIYPVYGHWVWGNAHLDSNEPWLAKLGFIDFAGASVVHGVGGWASLVGIKLVGPRMGRFSSDGSVNNLEANSLSWSALGVLILWMGWWGFNGGSTLAFTDEVPVIILNTNLAAATAAMAAFVHAQKMQAKEDVEAKFLGGALGGLVAITACCHVVTPVGAMMIGACAGVIHNHAFVLVRDSWKLDDVVGAVPVHGFCGAWGLLSVGIFGELDLIGGESRVRQVGIQALGIVVCFVWTTVTTFVALMVLKVVTGIRVAPFRELRGLTLSAEVDDDDEDDDDDDDEIMYKTAAVGLESSGDSRY